MSLRLAEILVPAPSQGAIEAALDEHTTLARWTTQLPDERVRISALISGEAAEAVLNDLSSRVETITDARVILLPVEATLPRPDQIAEEEEQKAGSQAPTSSAGAVGEAGDAEEEQAASGSQQISTVELYQDVDEMSGTTSHYVGLVVLSTIVAAVGLVNGSLIAIIGAMVIAPLIGPNVGLAMATTLADLDLARKSILTSAVGVAAALAVGLMLGAWLPVDPTIPEMADRTAINLLDLGLALAAGAAAVLSLTVGVSTALVGVMVAVALLPPLAAAGLFAGAGLLEQAGRAALLATSNLICINLAGVVTFLVQGVRPAKYWEAEKARRATVSAIVAWTVLLGLLVAIIAYVPGLALLPNVTP